MATKMTTLTKRISGGLAAVAVLMSLSGPTSAALIDAVWEDDKTWTEKLLTDSNNWFGEFSDGYEYSHNIGELGDAPRFSPGDDSIDSAWIRIWLSEVPGGPSELAEVDISWLFSGSGGLFDDEPFNFSFNFNSFVLNGWGIYDLEQDGKISVSLEPDSGSFYLNRSLLHAEGRRVVAVPEPGTLALLALGLIGMGVALARRRKHKK